tara:strand:+ start:900 stop:1058 length:159 start_codon:yes stop_codon:yes gene_type:complete
MKKYTFDLLLDKNYENKHIVVEAENEDVAKTKLLKELHLLNKKFIKVMEFKK